MAIPTPKRVQGIMVSHFSLGCLGNFRPGSPSCLATRRERKYRDPPVAGIPTPFAAVGEELLDSKLGLESVNGLRGAVDPEDTDGIEESCRWKGVLCAR
jgi:hypothetical protein